jgi:hypothetical protein
MGAVGVRLFPNWGKILIFGRRDASTRYSSRRESVGCRRCGSSRRMLLIPAFRSRQAVQTIHFPLRVYPAALHVHRSVKRESMMRKACFTLLVLLSACAPSLAPRGAASTPSAAPSSVSEQTLPGLVDDATRLLQPTNAERLQALLALLQERDLGYQLQTVPNPRRAQDEREQGQNVILSFGAGAREIILGAHFDAARLPDGTLSGGMVDNAAGVIVLTRVADALRTRALRHRVRVVFFDLEEVGLVGSRHFVDAVARDRVAAMINLDIAGYGDAVGFGPAAAEGNAHLYRAMWRTCAEVELACVEFPRYPPSDDRSFQAAGIPNISIAVLPEVDAHQLWLLLNAGAESGLADGFVPRILRTIHTAEDRAERLDAAAMTRAYHAVLDLLLRLDQQLP